MTNSYAVADNLKSLADMAADYVGENMVTQAVTRLEIALLVAHATNLRAKLPKRPRKPKLEDGLTAEEANLLHANLRNKILVIKKVRERGGFNADHSAKVGLKDAKDIVDRYVHKHGLTHYDPPLTPWAHSNANDSQHHYGPTA